LHNQRTIKEGKVLTDLKGIDSAEREAECKY